MTLKQIKSDFKYRYQELYLFSCWIIWTINYDISIIIGWEIECLHATIRWRCWECFRFNWNLQYNVDVFLSSLHFDYCAVMQCDCVFNRCHIFYAEHDVFVGRIGRIGCHWIIFTLSAFAIPQMPFQWTFSCKIIIALFTCWPDTLMFTLCMCFDIVRAPNVFAKFTFDLIHCFRWILTIWLRNLN